MDYEAKAKELRERIFSHAEEGHGGPCLRSGPLDKMLEEWLRVNFAPQAPSYDYGHRVAAAPVFLDTPERGISLAEYIERREELLRLFGR